MCPIQTATVEEFATFIEYIEQAKIPLAKVIPRTELLYRIYYVTEGIAANIMNLMNLSAVLVEERGQGEITPDILSLAFQKRLARHIKGKVNPYPAYAEIPGERPERPGENQGYPDHEVREPQLSPPAKKWYHHPLPGQEWNLVFICFSPYVERY